MSLHKPQVSTRFPTMVRFTNRLCNLMPNWPSLDVTIGLHVRYGWRLVTCLYLDGLILGAL